jgi:hypothetical protein
MMIDARGPRFGAALTTVVLAISLLTHNGFLIAWQTLVFAIGAFKNPTATPYAFIYKNLVKPRLKGEVPTEDVRPPKFAQLVGFLFAVTALVGAISKFDLLFTIPVAFALAAALLNAAFDFCLGCEIYLLGLRLRTR